MHSVHSAEMEQMKVEFVGTFTAANLKAIDWLTSHLQIRLVSEVGPIRAGCTGPNSYDAPDWTITIEYEDRDFDVRSRTG